MCGIFAVSDNKHSAELVRLGLFSLQHRGQESAGIAVSDGNKVYAQVGMGLVSEALTDSVMRRLSGKNAIGHVRYSTTGSSHIKNAQPLLFEYVHGQVAVAH
ncbi:MAG: amidophosphoribosyltransferase, partial [Elusimicrobia bacterium]|nr:amidophosphoribosyltransferase [Elusimicrobiota bacterium]